MVSGFNLNGIEAGNPDFSITAVSICGPRQRHTKLEAGDPDDIPS
jgi:hypothetical protein